MYSRIFSHYIREFRWKQYYGALMDINLIITVTSLLDVFLFNSLVPFTRG